MSPRMNFEDSNTQDRSSVAFLLLLPAAPDVELSAASTAPSLSARSHVPHHDTKLLKL